MSVRNKPGFPGVPVVKNLPTKGDVVSTPDQEDPEWKKGKPLQYSA